MKPGNLIRILLGLLVALAGVVVPYRTASAAHAITAADTKAVPRMVSLFGDNTTQSRNSVLGPSWSALFVRTSGAADGSAVTADLKSFLLSILPATLPARVSEAAWTTYLSGLETTALTQTASGSGMWRYNLVMEDILGAVSTHFSPANMRAMILQGMQLGAKTIPVKVVDHATPVTGSIDITVVDAQIALAEGWNLRSTPLASASNSDTWGEVRALGRENLTTAQLDALFPQGFFWDAATQAFGSLITSKALAPLEAIFINVSAGDAIGALGAILNRAGGVGSPPSRSMALNWNLIGTSPDFTVNFTSLYKSKLRGMAKVDESLISLFIAPGGSAPPGYSTVISLEYGPVTTTKLYTYGATLTNGTGTAVGAPVALGAANTITVTTAGTFTVSLAAGMTGTATSGTATVTGTPVALAAGANIITSTTGAFTITITGVITLFSYDWWFREPAWTYPRGGAVPAFDATTGDRWMSPFGGAWVGMDNADTFLGLGITPVPDCWLLKLLGAGC